MYRMGYRLSFTEIYASYVVSTAEEKEIAPKGWYLLTGCTEFSRRYSEDVFQSLPEGWAYWTDPDTNDNFCRIVYFEIRPYVEVTKKEINAEIREVMRGMERWAAALYESKMYAVYRLGGLL